MKLTETIDRNSQLLYSAIKYSAIKILVLAIFSVTALRAEAQATPYAQMAAIDAYLSKDPVAEIVMARSAAPAAVSRDATVLLLEKNGYRTVVEGKNGFTCLVERAWMSPFDSPEFWNPKMRGPICYNPAAARTVLLYTINRTKLALAGVSKTQMRADVLAAIAKNELPVPEPGAMSFMLSKAQNLGDSNGHWCPHLMFHLPKTEGATWGADLAGSPVIIDNQHLDSPEPETIFMVPVFKWSDGTPAPHEAME